MSDELLSKDNDVIISTGNDLGKEGKITAGILLILFTIFPIILLVAYWPNKLPETKQEAVYENKWFQMNLKSGSENKVSATPKNLSSKAENAQKEKEKKDTTNEGDSINIDSTKKDNLTIAKASPLNTDSLDRNKEPIVSDSGNNNEHTSTINLNSILLILVSTAGFLGSMIYIASSFTNFVGSESFKKSWLLWYIVKPFTGSGLAIVIYFVFRAGFLNFNDPSNINLFGIVTIAAFAGLFADDATLKLKEIFEVIFRPKDDRPNKLNEEQIRITGIKPDKLILDGENNLIISGEKLDKGKLILKINDQLIQDAVIKGDAISFSYKIPETLKTKKDFKLTITDEKGNVLYTKTLGI